MFHSIFSCKKEVYSTGLRGMKFYKNIKTGSRNANLGIARMHIPAYFVHKRTP